MGFRVYHPTKCICHVVDVDYEWHWWGIICPYCYRIFMLAAP